MSQSLRTTKAGPKVTTFLNPIDGTTAVLGNHFVNNVIPAGLKILAIRTDNI